MITRIVRVISFAIVTLTVVYFFIPTCIYGEVIPPEITQLREAYYKEAGNIVEQYNSTMLPLAENYVLELRKLAVRLSQAKDQSGMEAVRKEASRFMQALAAEPDPFESVPEMMKENIVQTPDTLRIIQEEYIAKRNANQYLCDKQLTELAQKYSLGLEQVSIKLQEEGDNLKSATFKKEATRVRVVLQRKDQVVHILAEAKVKALPMPPAPDPEKLKERVTSEPQAKLRNLTALTLQDLSPVIQEFLLKPLEYDKEWPPEITKWRYEGFGNYSHDYSLYNMPEQPDELGIFVFPNTMRAYVRGTTRYNTLNFDNKPITWMGKAMSWLVRDSRDLVCKVVCRTRRPAINEESGPALSFAVYSLNENNRIIASMSVPVINNETVLQVAKHYSYNRLNLEWEGSKRRRGFTIPDHMPMRVVTGIVGYAAGEEIDATLEIIPSTHLGTVW